MVPELRCDLPLGRPPVCLRQPPPVWHDGAVTSEPHPDDLADATADIADAAAVQLISAAAVHLMTAAAVKCGLASDTPTVRGEDLRDLDEARKLITALAGLVTAAAPDLGNEHARSLRDGLRTLQLAFRDASAFPDPPGQGPGEHLTGPVS